MNITGKNLRLVHQGLSYGIQEVHNMIATCPDVFAYADEIEGYEREKEALERLQARVWAAIGREEARRAAR
jgi:hypothetical protein